MKVSHLRPGWVLLAALILTACGSSPPAQERRDTRAAPDQPDPERRAKVRLELASAYFSRGQTATALEEVKQALLAKPDMPDALNLRGLILASQGDRKQAEESFIRALQVKPGDPDTTHNYGWFLCQNGRYPEAEAQFQAVLSQPQYPDAVRTLLAQGACQARSGRWQEAERTLSRSYELDPANPATAYNLSEVLYRRGEYERARFYIRRVNAQPELSNAQTLWLAARIERRMGNSPGLDDLVRQLRDRYPQSPESLQLERGRFDD
jgi:type IV pilus assembly protein PilF